jgi:hypothetical protein
MAKKISEAELHIKGKDKTKTAFTSVQGRLHRLKNSLVSMKGAMTLLIGAGFIAMTKEALKSADAIGKFADRASITTKELQKMRFAFDLAGVGSEKFDKGLITFGKRLGKAVGGTGALHGGLIKIEKGLLDSLNATNTVSEALEVLFIATGKAAEGKERLAILDAAFGGSGLHMASAFKNGSAALFEAMQRMEDMGLVIEDKLIRNAEQLNDDLMVTTEILKMQFIPAFLEMAPAISEAAKQLGNFFGHLNSMTQKAKTSELSLWEQGFRAIAVTIDEAGIALSKLLILANVPGAQKMFDIYTARKQANLQMLVESRKPGSTKKSKSDLRKELGGEGIRELTEFTDKGEGWGKDETLGKAWALPGWVDQADAAHKSLDGLIVQRKRAIALLKEEVLHGQKKIPMMEMENELLDTGAGLLDREIEAYRKKFAPLVEAQQKLNDQLILQNKIVSAAESIFDRAGDGILRAMQKGEDAFESFKNVAMAALFDIGREMMKLMVFDPIKEAARPLLGQLAGSIGSAIGGSMFGGGGVPVRATDPTYRGGSGHAEGGFVHAGKPALVGEKGAEIFMPRVGGTIIPNDQLGGGGVNITLNLSTGIQSTVRAEVMGMMPIISANVKSAVAEARQRGGAFSEAMGV